MPLYCISVAVYASINCVVFLCAEAETANCMSAVPRNPHRAYDEQAIDSEGNRLLSRDYHHAFDGLQRAFFLQADC